MIGSTRIRPGAGLVLTLLLWASVPVTAADTPPSAKPESRTVRQIEGWTVRVDDRLDAAAQRGAGQAHPADARSQAGTDWKEFFAEMTGAYFGENAFFPFNRAELMTAGPEIHELMTAIWGAQSAGQSN